MQPKGKTNNLIKGGMGLLLGALFSIYSVACSDNPVKYDRPKNNHHYKDYDITSTYENLINDNLERPQGLSSYKGGEESMGKSVKIEGNDTNHIFATTPWYKVVDGIVRPSEGKALKIWSMDGNLKSILEGGGNTFIAKEFPPETMYEDCFTGYGTPEDTTRPVGLDLDTERLENGDILLSSNVSNTLFKIKNGSANKYISDDEIYGTTDMETASDGRIYLVQQPIRRRERGDNEWIMGDVIRQKRVISIGDAKDIRQEFVLPSETLGQLDGFQLLNYGHGPGHREKTLLLDEQLNIVENSKIGKERFGYKFYVSDMLAGKIYGVKGSSCEVLVEGGKFPSSINVGKLGNIFYTTTPLWDAGSYGDYVDYPTELYFYLPGLDENKRIHQFWKDTKRRYYYFTKVWAAVNYKGKEYHLPTGFSVSSILGEEENMIRFLFTNSYFGTLRGLKANKQVP